MMSLFFKDSQRILKLCEVLQTLLHEPERQNLSGSCKLITSLELKSPRQKFRLSPFFGEEWLVLTQSKFWLACCAYFRVLEYARQLSSEVSYKFDHLFSPACDEKLPVDYFKFRNLSSLHSRYGSLGSWLSVGLIMWFVLLFPYI